MTPSTTFFLVLDGTVMFAVTVGGDPAARRDAALDYFGSCMMDAPSGAEVEAAIADGTYELLSEDNVAQIFMAEDDAIRRMARGH